MVDSSKSFVCCVEESKVVGVHHHIAFYVPDERFGRMQLFRQGSGGFVEDVVQDGGDDGVGLDHASDDGMGRSSMKARAEEHGGTISIASGPAGTIVTAVLPLNGQAIA